MRCDVCGRLHRDPARGAYAAGDVILRVNGLPVLGRGAEAVALMVGNALRTGSGAPVELTVAAAAAAAARR